MSHHVRRRIFDSYAPRYMNEVFMADRVERGDFEPATPTGSCETEIMVGMRRPPA